MSFPSQKAVKPREMSTGSGVHSASYNRQRKLKLMQVDAAQEPFYGVTRADENDGTFKVTFTGKDGSTVTAKTKSLMGAAVYHDLCVIGEYNDGDDQYQLNFPKNAVQLPGLPTQVRDPRVA